MRREFGLTQMDFELLGVELIKNAGLTEPPGNVVITIWSHEEECPMHPAAPKRPTASSLCRCGPDADALVNPYCADQRRVPLIRDGRVVPIARSAGQPPPWCRSSKPSRQRLG